MDLEKTFEERHPVRAYIDKIFPIGIFGFRVSYVLLHPYIIFTESYCRVKWAWQRVFRGWDDRAAWDTDSYLAELIPQLLKVHLKYKDGVPSSVYNDGTLPVEIYRVEWDNILREIISGFEAYKKDDIFNEKAFQLFIKYYQDLWMV